MLPPDGVGRSADGDAPVDRGAGGGGRLRFWTMELLAPARRWLAALLGLAYLFDFVLNLARRDGLAEALLPLPLLAFTLLALARPLLGVVGGALWLVGGSYVAAVNGQAVITRVGIETLFLSETVAIGALVAIAVWRGKRGAAFVAIPVLAVAGMAASVLRLSQHYSSYYYLLDSHQLVVMALSGGVVLLGGCIVGYALRTHDDHGTSAQTRQLIRRQWPLAAALLVLILVDMSSSTGAVLNPVGRDLIYLVPVVFLLATAACAVLGPIAPVRYTMIAAVVMVGASMALSPLTLIFGSYSMFPVPLSVAAAHMALVAYLARYAERGKAAAGVGALVVVDVLVALSVYGMVDLSWEFMFIAGFLLVVAVATGQYFRSRDRERAQSVKVAVTGAQQAERMALARELHDVVAHHVTGIVVAAQAARMVGETNPAAAVQAMERIEAAGGEALAAMRMLVGSMRGAPVAGAEGQATMDLAADLRALVENFAGPEIDMTLDLPDSLPPEAGRSVLRIVQEALTNVGKHARGATKVTISIGVVEDELRLRVADDATRVELRPPGGSGGYGLVGMRERIDLLGGRFTAGPDEPNGWVVDAGFPLRAERAGRGEQL
ncbi:two-component sensor histidine kinase [Actinokineospora globicatena]|nr:two-component sensor histidine kinase [Actinokineospora globicatena]GLW84057.1 two-component sensor histidine kinase [Actinokineospora globicatena]